MKINTKLTILGSLAILATSPLGLAESPTVTEVAPDVVIAVDPIEVTDGTDTVVKDDGMVEGEVTDGEVVDGEVVDGGGEVVVEDGGGEVIDPTTVEDGTGEVTTVPLDWIKRGGGLENPDVIFYNMVGGPGPVFKNETSSPVAKQIGPDGKATAIEDKENSGVSQLNREKKAPVALVKKGRVFLR